MADSDVLTLLGYILGIGILIVMLVAQCQLFAIKHNLDYIKMIAQHEHNVADCKHCQANIAARRNFSRSERK